MSTLERRFSKQSISLRSTSVDSPGVLTGYCCRWMRLSSDLGGWRERIARNAFARTLDNGDNVFCLKNHDVNFPLGRTSNKSLKLEDDFLGLRVMCLLPPTSFARDLAVSIGRQDISSMSFAFSVEPGGEDWDDEVCDPDDPDFDEDCEEKGRYRRVRTVRAARLIDVSFVTQPAYESTSAHVSSVDTPPVVMHSAMFPEGLPAEIRSRVGNTEVRRPRTQDARRKLFNLFVG